MTERRERGKKQIVIGVGILLAVGILYWYHNQTPQVADFTECTEAGYSVLESYPRQCRTPDERTFKEDIGNELEQDDMIRISEPRPNTIITSPLTVKGVARGSWFFEASFPVRLFDGNGELIGHDIAQAQGDPTKGGVNWMTEEFVPFEATLEFALPATKSGTLLLDKDNPSGLPENTDALRVPVRFR